MPVTMNRSSLSGSGDRWSLQMGQFESPSVTERSYLAAVVPAHLGGIWLL